MFVYSDLHSLPPTPVCIIRDCNYFYPTHNFLAITATVLRRPTAASAMGVSMEKRRYSALVGFKSGERSSGVGDVGIGIRCKKHDVVGEK